MKFFINEDIRKATTLPASFYKSEEVFEALKEKVFARTWQWIGDQQLLRGKHRVYPLDFMPHFIDEPMLLSSDANGEERCLSNVCTHRGNLLVHDPGDAQQLRCMYHGRRFGMDGKFTFMPEFKEAEGFPRPCDSLHEFPLKKWQGFFFTGLEPAFDLSEMLEEMNKRVGFMPITQFKFDAAQSKEYLVSAHWALYCDNYLEGFHIPFVHQDLNATLDYGNYATKCYAHGNLQIGYASEGTSSFELPEGHIDYGKNIAAYYYWLFPNMMFNFYPWGLSINIVKPISKNRTKVSFLSYIYDESKVEEGAGALLDKVEREDEFVVEGVQKGLQSRYYQEGRFSPSKEQGVHHFHRLLASFL